MIDAWSNAINSDGFVVIPHVFDSAQIVAMLAALHRVFESQSSTVAMRSDAGSIYAARNILSLWPGAAAVCARTAVA